MLAVGRPLRDVREVGDAGRGDDLPSLDRPVRRLGDEVPVAAQRGDALVLDVEAGLRGEPLRVGEEDRERDRILADLALVEVAGERQLAGSGLRLVLTLAYELRRRGGGYGVATLCGGGGQGEAVLLKV